MTIEQQSDHASNAVAAAEAAEAAAERRQSLSSMSISKLKAELKEMNHNSFVFNDRSELELALEVARKKNLSSPSTKICPSEGTARIVPIGIESKPLTNIARTPGIAIKYEIIGGDEIVNRFIGALERSLRPKIHKHEELGQMKNTSIDSKILNIKILQCTEGSRMGRICCAEMGVGWVVLEIQWALKDEKGNVLANGSKKLQDSGNIGIADLCASDIGERRLLDTMAPKLAAEIKSNTLTFL